LDILSDQYDFSLEEIICIDSGYIFCAATPAWSELRVVQNKIIISCVKYPAKTCFVKTWSKRRKDQQSIVLQRIADL